MDELSEDFRGNLHAYEYMLGQLYVMQIENYKNPQGFVEANAKDILEKLANRDWMPQGEKEAAYGSVRRVMETASASLEASGYGPAIDLRSNTDRH